MNVVVWLLGIGSLFRIGLCPILGFRINLAIQITQQNEVKAARKNGRSLFEYSLIPARLRPEVSFGGLPVHITTRQIPRPFKHRKLVLGVAYVGVSLGEENASGHI